MSIVKQKDFITGGVTRMGGENSVHGSWKKRDLLSLVLRIRGPMESTELMAKSQVLPGSVSFSHKVPAQNPKCQH